MDAQTANNLTPEVWQVDTGSEIYEGSFEELTKWITEGTVLPQDKVRRGNLRWIEANRVPTLIKFFNSNELGAVPPVVTTNSPKPFPKTVAAPIIHENQANFCLVHIETEAKFLCDGCSNFFCKECPSSFGASVKVCPMCGEMCKPLDKAIEDSRKAASFQTIASEGFGFADFGRALTYPFKYPSSFIFGALFFGFFTVASKAASIGGIWLLAGAIISWMLANMLTFGILSNMVENMLQGKLDQNFMPGFDDFNLWDDVIHPLLLNVSVYLSSFGLLILLSLVMIYFISNSFKPNDSQSLQTVQTVAPDAAPDFSSAQNGSKQIDFFKEAIKRQNEISKQRMDSVENEVENAESANPSTSSVKPLPPPAYDEEKEFQQMNEMINKTRQQQLESTIGKQTDEQINVAQYYGQILKWGILFILLGGIAFLWGVFYLPVAYIVAAYTRNIGSVFNPAVGLDTIRRLGFDYVKILLMSFVLLIFSGVLSIIINVVLASFNLPRIGNIPAIAVGSVVTFYFFIVFSVILGSALYKNSNKFPLYKTI